MFTLYDNIKRLCDIKGVSPSKMCLDIGKSKSLISALRTGKTTGINQESANLMAEYFGVSVDEVLHGKREIAQTDSLDDDIMNKVHSINENEDTREMLDALMHRSDLRALLHAGKDATPEQIEGLVEMLRRFKGE